jgi:hypothetical protein
LYKVGLVFVIGGIVLMLLTLLDYLQDGKTDAGIIAVEVLLIITGLLMYLGGKKAKARDK